MKLFPVLMLIILLSAAYYSGIRGWGAEFLLGWMEDLDLHQMLANIRDFITSWF